MLLFEISNGQNSDFYQCDNDDYALTLGSPSNICVPYDDAGEIQFVRPGDKLKTELKIYIENLQIIEIDSHAIILSLDFEVQWSEKRLILNVLQLQTAYVRPEDQGKIWSPEIIIANNKMLENKEQEEFGFFKFAEGEDFGRKKFYLDTKVTCAMDFENFPFDNHVCNNVQVS